MRCSIRVVASWGSPKRSACTNCPRYGRAFVGEATRLGGCRRCVYRLNAILRLDGVRGAGRGHASTCEEPANDEHQYWVQRGKAIDPGEWQRGAEWADRE